MGIKRVLGCFVYSCLAAEPDQSRKKRQTTSRKKLTVQEDTTLCSLCGIQFGDKNKQMTDDWIQCCQCSAWFHETCGEECGLLDDDVFYCKNCIN